MNKEFFFEEIYNIYSKKLKNYILKFISIKDDHEDICQNISITIYENIEKISKLQNPAIEKFIFSIARSKLIDYLRSRKTNKKHFENVSYDKYQEIFAYFSLSKILEKEEKTEKDILVKKMLTYINSMENSYKNILNDFYIEELDLKQISKKRKIKSLGTIASILSRGRQQILNESGIKF